MTSMFVRCCVLQPLYVLLGHVAIPHADSGARRVFSFVFESGLVVSLPLAEQSTMLYYSSEKQTLASGRNRGG